MAAGAGTAVKLDQLRSAKIAPDVVSELGPSVLDFRVAYKEVEVANGLAIRKAQSQQRPHVELRGEPFLPNHFYTLLMVDPDAPHPNNPTSRNFLHWMVINIPGGTSPHEDIWNTGSEVVEYMGPAPPLGTHRYVILIFEQKGTLHVSKIEGREKFDVNGFAANFEPQYPVGAVYYLVEHDDTLKHPKRQV